MKNSLMFLFLIVPMLFLGNHVLAQNDDYVYISCGEKSFMDCKFIPGADIYVYIQFRDDPKSESSIATHTVYTHKGGSNLIINKYEIRYDSLLPNDHRVYSIMNRTQGEVVPLIATSVDRINFSYITNKVAIFLRSKKQSRR